MSNLPDYYQILGVSSTADAKQIRDGYRKASLKTHPDRNPQATPAERRKLTEDFQKVADAYYVLSDPTRRRDYDAQRSARPNMFDSTSAGASADYFANFFQSNFGASAAGGAGAAAEDEGFAESESSSASGDRKDGARPDPDQTFGDVFEELLRPEIQRTVPMWTWVGAAGGGALGFIAGNLPGAAIGAFGGSKLGAVRDAKGKAVYQVFVDLGADQKAQVLKGLAAKVFSTMSQ